MKNILAILFLGIMASGCTDDADPTPTLPLTEEATGVTASGFTANWTSVLDPETFELDVATDENFLGIIRSFDGIPGDERSYSVEGLQSNTLFYYRVRGVNGSTASPNSPLETVTTLPEPPSAMDASDITVSSFIAQWQPANGIFVYELDVSEDSDFNTFLPDYNGMEVINNMWLVNGLESNTTYFYRLRSKGTGGVSENSNVIEVTTLP